MQRVRNLIKAGIRASGWELRVELSAASVTGARGSSTRGMVVEFVGPSGIGKTTLCRQIAPRLRRDWFLERHAAALVRQGAPSSEVPVPGPVEAYLARLHAHRMNDLAGNRPDLVQHMQIVGRMSAVIAQAAAARRPGLPRGFILDDGVAHFFAEAMLAQPQTDTMRYVQGLAFVFLMPPEFAGPAAPPHDPEQAGQNAYEQRVIYRRLHDMLAGLGCPVLLLSSTDRQANPGLAHDFIAGLVAR